MMMAGVPADGAKRLVRGVAAALAVASSAALLAACSAFSDPTYPAVHDMPAPRSDTPMSAAELNRATNALVTERTTLSTEAQAAAQANAQANAQAAADAAAVTGTTPPKASAQPNPPAAGAKK